MVMIKDSITGIITEFSWDYYRKGVLMASSNQKIEEELNKDLWDCPQCGRHTMDQVQFSTYSASPDGEPGLLCFHCHYMLAGEELESYMVDEDGRRDI